MTAHRFTNVALAIVGALAMAFVLSASFHLDGPDDHHAEHAQALALGDAQKQAARELRRDLAAAELCRLQHGESGYSWTEAGSLVCLPRKGKRTVHATTAGLEVQP
jgi:hypothetical protein